MVSFLRKALLAIASLAIARATLRLLAEFGVFPDIWLANMVHSLGLFVQQKPPDWIGWVLAGILALLLYLLWNIAEKRLMDYVTSRRKMPVKEALDYAHSELRDTLIGQAAERLCDNDPLRWMATHMIISKNLPVFGYRPHRRAELEEIDDETLGWNELSDDFDRLESNHIPPRVLFRGIRFNSSDVENYVREQRGDQG